MNIDCYFVQTIAMHKTLLPFFIALVLLAGCARSQRELSPNDGKLISAYAGLILVREEFRRQRSPADSLAYQQRVREILTTNGLTEDELARRISELSQSQDAFRDFQSRVRQELERTRPQSPPAQ